MIPLLIDTKSNDITRWPRVWNSRTYYGRVWNSFTSADLYLRYMFRKVRVYR